jgi:hypothetical protein
LIHSIYEGAAFVPFADFHQHELRDVSYPISAFKNDMSSPLTYYGSHNPSITVSLKRVHEKGNLMILEMDLIMILLLTPW